MKGYNPIERAEKLRKTLIKPGKPGKVLIASFSGTEQAKDMIVHTNIADEYFRAKVYTKLEDREWDPFLSEPAGIAAKKLTIEEEKRKRLVTPEACNSAFLGQIGGCNLNCWQCYVDDVLKSGNPRYGTYLSAEEYLIWFLVWSKKTQNSPDPDEKLNILRISGGEPFIVPEFVVWMIEAVEKYNLQDYLYLWVDTNLCTGDFYWKYLSPEERKKIRNYRNIGFCGCYKGFDEKTFYKTTQERLTSAGADPRFFHEQFKMHRRLIDEGLDVYTYLYPFTYSLDGLKEKLTVFMDRLIREVDKFAPLRMATPETKVYGPTKKRLTPERAKALKNQWIAMKIWKEELQKRFNPNELALKPHEVPVRS